jgi:hypothetical protein
MPDKTTKSEPKPKVTGATSGVLASGPAGKAARQAAKDAVSHFDGQVPEWDRPDAKYKDTDNSIDARMWRLKQDHIAMGSRKA